MKYRVNGVLYTEKQLENLVARGYIDASKIRLKNDPASTSLANTQTAHGFNQGGSVTNQSGLFSDGRVRPDRFSSMQQPASWVQTLPLVASEIENEMLELVTGQQGNQGTDAAGFCANPPTAGNLKTMTRLLPYGNWYMKTQLNPVATIGSRLNYADVSGRILNEAGGLVNPYIPDVLANWTDTRDQLAFELYKLGNALRRSLTRVMWQGAAGQNVVTDDGWFLEPAGFASQVRTGYTDLVTGAVAPAADSVVINWGDADIGAEVGGLNIVETIHDLYYSLTDRASSAGMDVQFEFVMRKETFRRLLDVYACTYATARCDGSANAPVNRDGMEVQRLRTEMASGRYLLVDGVPVPVAFDDGVFMERIGTTTPIVLDTSIFLMPRGTVDGIPLTYMGYHRMDNAYATRYSNFVSDKVEFLNNGLYVMGERSTGLCFEYLVQSRMRPILETPFLAGRIDNIRFSYTAQTRTANPADAWGYVNGGRTFNPVPVEPPA